MNEEKNPIRADDTLGLALILLITLSFIAASCF